VTLEFRLLGTLEVEGGAAALGSGKQRAMLAYLLLRRNHAVPREALVDALWGEDPPATAAHALDVYASRVRKTLGGDGLLESRGGSFRLNVPDESVDVGRFERLLGEVRSTSDPGTRLAAADQALALWRGRALADVLDEPFARPESERLEEERLVVCEERFDSLLALGRHDEAIGELQSFVREHPLRERPRRELMLALYRAGRQSEALDVYREGRTILQDELGLEPSRELRELEAAILRQDDELAAPARIDPTIGAAAYAAEESSNRRRRALLAACVAVALVGASVAAALLLTGGGSAGLARIDFSGVAAVDPGSGKILSPEVIPSVSPGRLATAGGAIWTTNQADDTVSGIDKSAKVVHTIPVGSSPSDLVTGAGAVWVANTLSGTVSRIDPGTEQVVQTIPVGREPTAIAYGDGAVWVTNAGDRTVTRIDPKTGAPGAAIPSDADGQGVAFGSGSLWVVDQSTDTVAQIDPRSRAVVGTTRVGAGPAAITSAFGSIWVANSFDGTVSRISPRTGVVSGAVDVGGSPISVAATAKLLWVADETNHRLVAIDPATDTVARRVDLGVTPVAVAASPTRVWVSAQSAPGKHRGGTLLLDAPLGTVDWIDPAIAYTSSDWTVLSMTNDGLVSFRHTGGSDGAQIVPDLAVSVPTPTDGGTTYRFQLRRGIRYSNGAVVSPADVRFALERDFKVHSPGVGFYAGIVGAAACMKKPASCDLSRGVAVDPASNTVTFHLVEPDAEFLDKLALPFADALPAQTTPLRPVTTALPSTGPYMFTHYRKRRGAALVRNPHFHVWSDAAQPPGFPNRIVMDAAVTLDAATTAIERGKADVMVGYGPPANRLREVETRYASQVHVHPYSAVEYVFLNTRRPPFDDVRVRRALNYALDRGAIVRIQGGSTVAEPTCQVLPPLIPGYQPTCPYTRNPTASGAWTGPDLPKARALVAASGTGGMHVRLWSYSRQFGPYATEMGAVATALRKLGYSVTIHIPGDKVYYRKVDNSRVGAQAGMYSFLADYPAAGDFFQQYTCAAFRPASPTNVNVSEFCDPTTDKLVARAELLEPTDPQRADAAWAAVDRRVTTLAPMAPMYVQRFVDLVSRRAGNYEFNPRWGVLVDQLWVR
jgi:YVTN family beta-propeller protein